MQSHSLLGEHALEEPDDDREVATFIVSGEENRVLVLRVRHDGIVADSSKAEKGDEAIRVYKYGQ